MLKRSLHCNKSISAIASAVILWTVSVPFVLAMNPSSEQGMHNNSNLTTEALVNEQAVNYSYLGSVTDSNNFHKIKYQQDINAQQDAVAFNESKRETALAFNDASRKTALANTSTQIKREVSPAEEKSLESQNLEPSSLVDSTIVPSFYQSVPLYAQNNFASHAQLSKASSDVHSLANVNTLQDAAKAGPTGNALHMKLTKVNIASEIQDTLDAGNTLNSFIGQEIDAYLLQRVLNQVSRYYQEQGYSNARAFLPEQQLIDGELQVYLATTKLQDIEFENNTAVSDEYLAYLLGGLAEQRALPINQKDIESQLLKLSDLGIFNLKGGFRVLDDIGLYADLDLLAEPTYEDRTKFTIFSDNQGNESSGRYRFGGQMEIFSPFGIADRLSIFYARTNEHQNNYSFNYEVPVNSHPSVVGLDFCYSNYELGQEYQVLGAQGHSYKLEGYWREPLWRDQSNKTELKFGVRYSKLVDEFANFDVEFKKHTLAGYTNITSTHALQKETSVLGALTVTAGKLFIDDEYNLMPEDSYYILNVTAAVAHEFTPSLIWNTTIQGQLANTSLDGSEQFQAGGANGISALASSDLVGDSGLILRNQLLFLPWVSKDGFSFQFGPHIEAGNASYHGYASESAASTGLSMTLAGKGLVANLDFSTLLGDKPEYVEDGSRILFSLSYHF